MPRPTADALVLHFLYTVREAHLDRIARYMDSQWKHPRGTTRNALWRLVSAGMVERIGYMRYRRPRNLIAWPEDETGVAASGGAETPPLAWPQH